MQHTIAIIGGGNLGASLAEGLLNSDFVTPHQLWVTKRNVQTLQALREKGVHVTNNNLEAASNADYIVLAVKPFQVKEVLQQIQPVLVPGKQVLISLVTGVWIKDIREIVGSEIAIFRAMPNTAIAIQESMTCICASEVTEDQQEDDEVVERECALDQINGDVVDAVGAAGEQDHGDRHQQSEDQPADAPNDCLFARRLAAARKDEQVNEQECADDHDDDTDRQRIGPEGRERRIDQHR